MDLIEITIQTLVALDTLLRLLKTRREALDLLQSRLRWEEKRKDCWTSYLSLSHDLDDFVAQARWSPRIYHRCSSEDQSVAFEPDDQQVQSLADISPTTSRAPSLTSTSHARRLVSMLKAQATVLSNRCRTFVGEVVPLAGKQLDDVIEQRQVPEAFLDEQDRLEDLAESIKGREVFVIQLSLQWRKADELFRLLRALHIDSKQLSAAMVAAQRETPLRDRLTDFHNRSEAVKHRLGVVCGMQDTAHFLSDQSVSSSSLESNLRSNVPEPHCERWEDQTKLSDEIAQVLVKELAAAAKYVRQACHGSEKYQRSVKSFDRINALVEGLDEVTRACRHVTDKAQRGWPAAGEGSADGGDEELPSRLSSSSICDELDGSIPDLDDVRCLDGRSHDLYLRQFPKLKPRLGNTENEASRKIDEMGRAIRECIADGIPHSLFRRQADKAIHRVSKAREEARRAIENADLLLDVLKGARLLASQMDSVQFASSELIERVGGATSKASKTDTDRSFEMESAQNQCTALLQRAQEASRGLQALHQQVDGQRAHALMKELDGREVSTSAAVKEMAEVIAWLQTREKQQAQITALGEEYASLSRQGQAFKNVVVSLNEVDQSRSELRLTNEDGFCAVTADTGSLPAMEQKEILCGKIDQYVSTVHCNITLCGPAPRAIVQSARDKADGADDWIHEVDGVARQTINEWCSQLSTLSLEVEEEYREASENQSRRNQLFDVQQGLFVEALEELETTVVDGEKVCDWLDTTLRRWEDEGLVEWVEESEKQAQAAWSDLKATLKETMQRTVDAQGQRRCSSLASERLQRARKQAIRLVERGNEWTHRWHVLKQERRVNGQGPASIKQNEEAVDQPRDGSMQDTVAMLDERGVEYRLDNTEEGLGQQAASAASSESVLFPRTNSTHDRQSAPETATALEALVIADADEVQSAATVKRSQVDAAPIDVFGSTPLRDMSSSPKAVNEDVLQKRRLDKMIKQCSGGIVEEQTHPNGKQQLQGRLGLPSLEQAEAVKVTWKETKAEAEALLKQDCSALTRSEVEQARTTVQVRDAKVRRFTYLAAFAARQTATEEALSSFLNYLDQSEENNDERERKHNRKGELDHHLSRLTTILSQANEAAEPVLTDVRVRHQLHQLRHSFQDMAAMARDAFLAPDSRTSATDMGSVPPSPALTENSLPSLSGSGSEGRRTPASLAAKTSSDSLSDGFVVPSLPRTPLPARSRVQSSSSGTYNIAPQNTPHMSVDRRVVSDGAAMVTPSRLPLSSSRLAGDAQTPRGSGSTSRNHTPRTPPTPSSQSRRSRSDSGARLWSRLPVSTRATADRKTSTSKPNHYRPNPKSKLDVAVGMIVNKLPMQINITHASAMESKAKEQWQDESGRYWVGHPDPKLCFCRILRSRTVMVRVGGGWQELTTYILKHYSHLAPDTTLSLAPSPQVSPRMERGKVDKLPWISSASLLSTPTGKAALGSEYSPESAYLTPVQAGNDGQEAGKASPRIARSARSRTPLPLSPFPVSTPPLTGTPLDAEQKSPEEMRGMWIRRNRKASTSTANTAIAMQGVEEPHDHTRSTAASRNRNVSKADARVVSERRRVDSTASTTRTRVDSQASQMSVTNPTGRRTPRVSHSRRAAS